MLTVPFIHPSAAVRRVPCGLLAAAALLLAPAAPARAAYAPGATPASATPSELGDRDSTAPVISRDGRYVVFRTASAVLLGPLLDGAGSTASGLVRKDLLTGAVEPVAPLGAGGGASLSGDGRYVLFETALPLAAGDGNARTDVYRRDMTQPLAATGAYTLVSSLDGPPRSPTYRGGGVGGRTGRSGFGLSVDGQTAVFWTDSESTLPAGTRGFAPRAQVLVRRIDAQRTLLITRDKADPTLPGTPVAASGEFAGDATPDPVLSGAGGAVAWEDTDPARQLAFLPGEPTQDAALLWRDVTAGPAAPPRRVTGIADPDDPACGGGPYVVDPTAIGPCYGPFATSEAYDSAGNRPAHYALSISDDGLRVAFLSDAKRRPFDVAFQRRGLYVVDMRPGLSRKQATSEPIGLSRAISTERPIEEALLTGDGDHVVLTSKSDAFDGPKPLGTFQSGDLTATNVFVLDLAADAVERASRGLDGGDYVGPPLDPLTGGGTDDTFAQRLSATTDASAIAFQAGDGNLFVGDANGVTDVQVVRRAEAAPPSPPVAPPSAPSAPPLPHVRPLASVHPLIGVATVGPGGVATVTVDVPAPGRLDARAATRARGRALVLARVRRSLAHAQRVTLRLRPSRAARSALRAGATLKVGVRIVYRPRRGAVTRALRRYALAREALA